VGRTLLALRDFSYRSCFFGQDISAKGQEMLDEAVGHNEAA
jgi:hypothetical protein